MTGMIEVKVSELEGKALDWAVAKIEGYDLLRHPFRRAFIEGIGHIDYRPSTDWSQGGPLIDNHLISLADPGKHGGIWSAHILMVNTIQICSGATPLIAACRAIVAAKLGDTVQVPAELLNHA